MFKRFSISSTRTMAVLLTTALMVSAAIWSLGPLADTPALADSDSGAALHTNPVFARNIAGTWDEVSDGYNTLLNIRADGTLGWFGSWFFGNGTGSYLDGPVYGTWKQVGPLKIETIELGHLCDGDGSFVATGRVKEVFVFSEDFQTFTYSGVEDIFLPDQDPTDPDEVPVSSFEFAGGPFKRLNHMD